MSAETCSIEMCKNPSRTQCNCCTKHFCRQHFTEHDNLPNLQLDLFVDEINLLNDRLTNFDINELIGSSHQTLELWRVNCHKIIDEVFKEKSQEIDQRVNNKMEQQRNELSKIRTTATELIQKREPTIKDIDLLKAAAHALEEKINNMEQTSIEVVVRPLIIDDRSIRIEEVYIPHLDLSTLPPSYRKINRMGNSSCIIANNYQFFLIHKQPNLCLIDRQLSVIKRTQWIYGGIFDICWSSTLGHFFVLTHNNVYVVDDATMSIKALKINQNENFLSCTCSDTSLYLSTDINGSSIFKFNLFPSIEFEKQWTSPETCTQNQRIMSVVYENENLAMTISDPYNKEKHIELRSATTLQRLWSLKLDIAYGCGIFGCCSLNHSDWLVWDTDTSRLLHISKDGNLQTTSEYKEGYPFFALSYENQLVISTDNGINFHRIKT